MTENTSLQDVIYSLAAAPDFAQSGVCFAARGSGLYRSEDGGNTWQDALDSLGLKDQLATMAVALSPEFSTDQSVFVGSSGGLLCSFDGGDTWNVTMLPEPPPVVCTLVVSPGYTRDGILLAGTLEDGVFRSANRGGIWSAWNFGLLDLNILYLAISADFGRDETLFVGTETGIFRSTNGGRAWREVGFSVDWAPVLSLALSPAFATDGVLFAGTESYGLFRSDDRGHSWTRLGEDRIVEAVNVILVSPEFPARPDILVLLGDALLISRDGGETWSDAGADLDPEPGLATMVAPQGLELGAPVLVGCLNGEVQRIKLQV